jgi:hypothetical protein
MPTEIIVPADWKIALTERIKARWDALATDQRSHVFGRPWTTDAPHFVDMGTQWQNALYRLTNWHAREPVLRDLELATREVEAETHARWGPEVPLPAYPPLPGEPTPGTGGGPVDPGPGPGPLPPTDLDRVDGQLQVEPGGGFVVNGRPVLPTLCHYGDALSKWMRDRSHVLRNLDVIAGAGYHGIRYWTCLDGDWWNGRHVGERFQQDYWDQHRAFLLELKARGLVAQISQGSLTRDAVPERPAFANRMADLLTDVGPEVCALFEGVNEARDTGEPDAGRLASFVRIFKARLPQVLCALSAFTGTEDIAILDDFSRDPADLFVVHPYRGGGNHDKTRHLMSLRYEGKPAKRVGWNGEGPGGGNRVSAIDNRDAMTGDTMCGLAAMSFMMRMAYVWFSGVGVISDDGGSQTFDQMPGFLEVPKVRALVPADVMRYSGPIFHGGESWRAQRTFAARGDVRADHVVHSDGRQVIGIYGPGDLDVPQEKGFTAAVDHRFGSEFRLVAGHV